MTTYATYFSTKLLNIYIIISYELLNKQNKINLKEINLFKAEENVQSYIKRESLKLVEDLELSSKTNLKTLINLIKNYLLGEKINLFDEISELDIELDLQGKFPTKFSQEVINQISNLNYGQTTTYSNIGNKIGSIAYRAIGNVCKSNPIPLIIPCHRVLRKSGEIGGFMGKSDKQWETNLKKQLLRIEGYKI